MRSLYLALCLSLGPIVGAWAADPATDPAKLQGTWQAVTAERNGAPAPEAVRHRLVFTKDRFQITREGKLLYGGTYAADPSVQPARINFRQEEGSTLRGEWKGIYRFEAGRLEIIDNADDMSKPAPTQFVTTPGSGYVLLRFEPK
jgi:uncharacterized protein (TIGR03067 family)